MHHIPSRHQYKKNPISRPNHLLPPPKGLKLPCAAPKIFSGVGGAGGLRFTGGGGAALLVFVAVLPDPEADDEEVVSEAEDEITAETTPGATLTVGETGLLFLLCS